MQLTRITRANTPERWRAALRRAISEGIEVRQLQGSGMWIATSSTDPNTAYEVSPWECECHAGQFHDPICKHRAVLLVKLGRLRLAGDTHSHETTPCRACNGTGIHPDSTQRTTATACQECGGSGFLVRGRAA